MPEPTSQWGKEYAAKTEKLGTDLVLVTAQLNTSVKIATWAAGLLVAVAGYFFISVSNLKSSVEVLKSNVADLKSSAEALKSNAADFRSSAEVVNSNVADLKSSAEALKSAGIKLSGDMERDRETLEKLKQFLDELLKRQTASPNSLPSPKHRTGPAEPVADDDISALRNFWKPGGVVNKEHAAHFNAWLNTNEAGLDIASFLDNPIYKNDWPKARAALVPQP